MQTGHGFIALSVDGVVAVAGVGVNGVTVVLVV